LKVVKDNTNNQDKEIEKMKALYEESKDTIRNLTQKVYGGSVQTTNNDVNIPEENNNSVFIHNIDKM
jgi:hypothetical protein